VETTAGQDGEAFERWIGGYFRAQLSVNPFWEIKDMTLAAGHPITRGVKPFQVTDEFYYHMRFREGNEGVTPIVRRCRRPRRCQARWVARTPGRDPQHNSYARQAVLGAKEPQAIAWASAQRGGSRVRVQRRGTSTELAHTTISANSSSTPLPGPPGWIPVGRAAIKRPTVDDIDGQQR